MRIKHHYCLKNKIRLVDFLDKFQIPYEVDESSCTFDLYEDQEVYKKFIIQFPFNTIASLKAVEYSKEELENAQWLSVRNISIKVQWEFDEKAFKKSCSYKKILTKELYHRHCEQVDVLSAVKPVRWGSRQFFSGPNSADEIIFCSEKIKNILENKWEGLEFWPMKKYNTSNYIKDLYQLYFSKRLPIEAFNSECLSICKGCGKKVIRIKGGAHPLEINKKYLKDQKSVYTTGDVLTKDKIGYNTFSLNIVSQDFYQYCEKHQMNRGMIYEPINLI